MTTNHDLGGMPERKDMLEVKKIVVYGEEYFIYVNTNKPCYVLSSNRYGRYEVICAYEVTRENIKIFRMNTISTYFFSKEAMEKCEKYLNNKK